MKYSHLLFCLALLATLSACSSSHRPTYSGHEESTAGVPGFVNGKKVSPHVKLGQSYTVDGETYVPRNQPDYVEEGLASWYGPGFHGGKTANGERFDSAELTAAHRTLPLPSIVRVTMVSTGKSVYVRVNDRGPFAHSRILDLSRAAADKIGLLRAGVAKVRVEYMKAESEKFAELLAEGRDPKSIDLESEVLNGQSGGGPTVYARNESRPVEKPRSSPGFWDALTSPAHAGEPDPTAPAAFVAEDEGHIETSEAAPIAEVNAAELVAPRGAAAASSPFSVIDAAETPPPAPTQKSFEVAALTQPPPASGGGVYVQIGAFQNEENAKRLLSKYPGVNGLQMVKKTRTDGQTLFHVRMGPYSDSQASNKAFRQLQDAGAEAKIIKD